ncbi:MAG TPA: hypothetical protein VIL95_03590 [Bacillota bacterium]
MNWIVIAGAPALAAAFPRSSELKVATDPAPGVADLIVNGKALTEPDPSWDDAWVLNRPAAVRLATDKQLRRKIWARSGLRTDPPKRALRYRAHVFDLEILALFYLGRSGRLRPPRRVAPSGSKRLQRVVEAAVRAVYALRLDFGIVDLAVTRNGETVAVTGLSLVPPTRGRLAKVYAAAIGRYWRRWQVSGEDFLLGADPEFVVCDRKRCSRFVIASRHLPRDGPIGLDNQRVRGTRSARVIVEIRPRPAGEPHALLADIRRLLLRMPAPLRRRRLGWFAGSGPLAAFPTGGHVHFSGLPLTSALVRALDAYLALPLLLVEAPARARRRRRRYGYLGEVRRKDWGFEYRTLPSWLVAPGFASAVLSLSKLIGRHWRRLQRDPFLDPEAIEAFYECRKEVLRPHFEGIWNDLRLLPDYHRYAESLAALPSLVNSGLIWGEDRDFRRSWGIR